MSDTVTVASKLPFPLTLHLEERSERTEMTATGQFKSITHNRLPQSVTINGVSRDVMKLQENAAPIKGGYALTHGVDAEFWAKWLESHTEYPPIANGSIFAVDRPADAAKETRNYEKVQSGFEPLDPKNLPTEFAAKIAAG